MHEYCIRRMHHVKHAGHGVAPGSGQPATVGPRTRAATNYSCIGCNSAGFRYIGACYGSPGIGKTLSARTYAAADDCDRWFGHGHLHGVPLPASLLASRTVMWTPYVTTTPRELERGIELPHRPTHPTSNTPSTRTTTPS